MSTWESYNNEIQTWIDNDWFIYLENKLEPAKGLIPLMDMIQHMADQ